MSWSSRIAVVALVLPILAASGCTGTDVLSTGNADFVIAVEIVNPETRHNFALFTLSAVNVRPVDPVSNASLGAFPIGIFATADDLLTIDLNNLEETFETTLRLSTGVYTISSIDFANFIVVDFEGPMPAPNCQELISYPNPLMPSPITAANLGNPVLTVSEGGLGRFTVVIDGAAMIDAFEASFPTCDLQRSDARANQFVLSRFANAGSTFISFR